MGLRNQLLIIFVLIQILILGVFLYYFTRNHTDFYISQLKVNLENESQLIKSNDKVDLKENSRVEIDSWAKKWGEKIDTRITIISKTGKVIADSTYNPLKMDNHIDRPELQEIIEGNKSGSSIRKSSTLNIEMLYLATPINDGGELVGFIRLAKPLSDIKGVINKDVVNYLLFFVIIFLISLFLIWRFTSNLINPLQKMADMASGIARGNYKKRININNFHNEIGEVADKFNFMADQLENKINEVSEERNKAEAILKSMVDGVIATDNQRRVILINPAAREMLDLNNNDIQKRDLITVIRNHRIDDHLTEALTENTTLSREVVLQREDEKILRCHFAPITGKDNRVIGGVVVFTDITELRRLEQIRKDFVANVSHELKTPLTSIIGYVDTLIESKAVDQSTRERFLEIIKNEADRLALLIQDLLDLSKVEQNKHELRPANIEEIIRKTINMLKKKASKKDLEIRFEIESELPMVYMIKEQIEQVLINLIDNSIKYTQQGGEVVVTAYTQKNKVCVEVEDNGMGIPSEDQERIFERFYRVEKARSRKLGGTGIGLSIVKHILEGHNSMIQLESEVGEGTRFWFCLNRVEKS